MIQYSHIKTIKINFLFKIQKNTLQIGEGDHLRKGDILFHVNGEQLAYKNKFDLISRLGSLNGVAELVILRRENTQSCYGTTNDLIPYHNGIFAQNSIKLAMRKYEKPSAAIKSNSDIDVDLISGSLVKDSSEIQQKQTHQEVEQAIPGIEENLIDLLKGNLIADLKFYSNFINIFFKSSPKIS